MLMDDIRDRYNKQIKTWLYIKNITLPLLFVLFGVFIFALIHKVHVFMFLERIFSSESLIKFTKS